MFIPLLVTGLFLCLFFFLLGRTLVLRRSVTKAAGPGFSRLSEDHPSVRRLSEAVAIPTVSYTDYDKIDVSVFSQWEAFMEKSFPECHTHMEKTRLNQYAHIYRWPGKDPEKEPSLLLAHFDVVPAGEAGWKHPPFSGEIADGCVWGRGTLDTKNSLMAIMESAEGLISSGFTPEADIFFAFGGDEEVMGIHGASVMASYFAEKGTQFRMVLDEGAVIVENTISMVKVPLALIGTSEKGYANVRLSVQGKSGHSSMPDAHTAVGILSRGIMKLESRPFPLRLIPTVKRFFRDLTPYVSFPMGIVTANLWLFGGLLTYILSKTAVTNSLVRTTQAATVISGSDKENVLPEKAEAVVNIRILPGETLDTVLNRMRKTIRDDRVTVELLNEIESNNPVPEADLYSLEYRMLGDTIQRVCGISAVVPYLVVGTTDSKHYARISKNIYHFVPMKLDQEGLDRIHGKNECISLENYGMHLAFFTDFMKQL
ncbi:MAG: M20/M25/M40 family metallo-hydrolase [Spirochaetia bacterium]